MNLVSIIIPIYNAENFLRKCLDSIIAQTYTNWEAVLIDDGSPDNCGDICDEYAQRDCRFKVIHQKNSGVSAARQKGLDNTTGDYIIHCDPDDWIEPSMLKEMLDCAIKNNADMVICDFISHFYGSTKYESQEIGDKASAAKIQKMILEGDLHGSCCNKLVKKDVIGDISFYPTTISFCEDLLFNIKVLNKDINIVHIPKAFYHYKTDNNTSICNSKDKRIIFSRVIAVAEIEKNIRTGIDYNMYTIKKSILQSLFLAKCFKEVTETYPEIHKTIIKNHNKYYFFTPLGYFLSRALKKQPRTSYMLYILHIKVISFIQRIRKRNKS